MPRGGRLVRLALAAHSLLDEIPNRRTSSGSLLWRTPLKDKDAPNLQQRQHPTPETGPGWAGCTDWPPRCWLPARAGRAGTRGLHHGAREQHLSPIVLCCTCYASSAGSAESGAQFFRATAFPSLTPPSPPRSPAPCRGLHFSPVCIFNPLLLAPRPAPPSLAHTDRAATNTFAKMEGAPRPAPRCTVVSVGTATPPNKAAGTRAPRHTPSPSRRTRVVVACAVPVAHTWTGGVKTKARWTAPTHCAAGVSGRAARVRAARPARPAHGVQRHQGQ